MKHDNPDWHRTRSAPTAERIQQYPPRWVPNHTQDPDESEEEDDNPNH